jgi:8-oxo-dGTP pyrophosphatase MutT (NUDIX family)
LNPFVELAVRLRERKRQEWSIPGFSRAAVLVPLYLRDGEATLLFTQRSAALKRHSGQISFPGGRVDDTDKDAESAALREAEEEIGLSRGHVDLLGRLGDIPTPTTYVITPVVGIVSPPPELGRLVPSADEVAEIFEVSVASLRAPGLPEKAGFVEHWGQRFGVVSYKVEGRNIWGATARIVEELLEIL